MIKDSAILLDTCIVSNLSSKENNLVEKTQELIFELHKHNNLYISQFSKYELLKGNNEKNSKIIFKIISNFKIIENNEDRLNRAANLYRAYNNNANVRKTLSSISDVDIFIGSLIFKKENTYLLTADYFDFPRPFFLEKKHWDIKFIKNKGNPIAIYYYLLKANLQTILP